MLTDMQRAMLGDRDAAKRLTEIGYFKADGDAGGDGMKDPLNLLREAFDIYDSKKAPWEQSKEYFEKLKEFCDYSEKWRKEQEKTITRPHNRDAGETRMGTTEWDVFHELSAKRLKKNGIHL